MIEDNTPTVTARRRKPTRHMRLRLETAKKLRALGARKKAEKEAEKLAPVDSNAAAGAHNDDKSKDKPSAQSDIQTRAPRIKKVALAKPPVPKAKFRKRQVHKSWLPTHIFHAKRAHMTPPSAPLWRFSVPLSPTVKSYRPTHRASQDRGALAWDMSYVSTVRLQGRQDSIIGVLKAMGIDERNLYQKRGDKWRKGTRTLEAFVYERESPHHPIAPVTILWRTTASDVGSQERQVLLRVQPLAFFQLWEELLRLAKVAKPEVSVEDLRFEVGSIEVTGPGATEALLGALWPVDSSDTSDSQTWSSLAGLTNPATLPQNAILGFCVQDPRLHHPPRTIQLPKPDAEHNKMLEVVRSWPIDSSPQPHELFDRGARRAAGKALPSQKAVNRRKSLAPPGQYPEPSENDPKIPVILYTTSSHDSAKDSRRQSRQASWTVLLPWKCVQPVWYSVMYYPLSTGQQPRLGGLDQVRQLVFEAGQPWFPADFPGTKAGWEWEVKERAVRQDQLKRKPKAKRKSWEKVKLGDGKKGEVGLGWACEWERLLDEPTTQADGHFDAMDVQGPPNASTNGETENMEKPAEKTASDESKELQKPHQLTHLSPAKSLAILKAPTSDTTPPSALFTVCLTLITRGVPQTCARIYRLPSATTNDRLRKAWLALLPSKQPSRKDKSPKHGLPRLPKDAPPHIVQQRLAQSLVNPPKAGEDDYPACPGEEDLVGFVTTGNFNLAEGKGTGIGCLLMSKVVEDVRGENAKAGQEDLSRLCIVRNAGDSVGRLARWEVA
jgi:ribonuclease P/MRP protein subunit POP1